MRKKELEMRKELALTRMRIARTQLALARSTRPGKGAAMTTALDVASSVLGKGSRFGKWGRYARIALTVAQAMLGATRAL